MFECANAVANKNVSGKTESASTKPKFTFGEARIWYGGDEAVQRWGMSCKDETLKNSGQLSQQKSNNTIQLAPWNNYNTNFETDNETGGAIPNSVYLVMDKTYRRYAPINTIRAPGHEFHEDERTFVYIPPNAQYSDYAGVVHCCTQSNATTIDLNFDYDQETYVIKANWEPNNGDTVWDAKTDNDGKVTSGIHIGHAVMNKGWATNIRALTDEAELNRLRARKDAIIEAQKSGKILTDSIISDEMYDSIDNNNELKKRFNLHQLTDADGMKLWEKYSIIGQTVKSIQDAADKKANASRLLGIEEKAKILRRLKNITSGDLYIFSEMAGKVKEGLEERLKELDNSYRFNNDEEQMITSKVLE
jgi:hypothetical protein